MMKLHKSAHVLKKIFIATTLAPILSLSLIDNAKANTIIDLTPDGVTSPFSAQYRAQCCVVADRPDYTPPLSASMGVTFKTGSGDLWLDDFSLFLRQRTDVTQNLSGYKNSGGSMNFRAFIGSWGYNASLPAGSSGDLIDILYTSAITTTANNNDIQKFTFDANTQLAANQWYFAFISPEGLDAQPLRTYEMPVSYNGNLLITTSPNLWVNSSYDDFNQLKTGIWQAGWGPAWFEASLLTAAPAAVAAVPEPSTYAMMGLGLLGIMVYSRRRQNEA
jgi:hypothetical protein